MAINKLPTVADAIDVVYSEDPDVSCGDERLCWVDISDAIVQRGADVVRIRPLNCVERMTVGDQLRKGNHTGAYAWARTGTVSVNRQKDGGVIDRWYDTIPDLAILTLSNRVYTLTNGVEPGEEVAPSGPKSETGEHDAPATDAGVEGVE